MYFIFLRISDLNSQKWTEEKSCKYILKPLHQFNASFIGNSQTNSIVLYKACAPQINANLGATI